MLSKEDIFQIIVNHTREVVPALDGHNFKQTDSLRALGANSLDRADIVMMTLESLSLNVPMVVTANAENIGQLAHILHEHA